jgi:hypothetical protein
MGTIKKGILGGFNGKVGTVVGSNWKQTAYMRSLASSVKNPRTPAQLKHRAKFKMTMEYLQPLAPLIRIGWKHFAKKNQSVFNVAFNYFFKNVMGPYWVWELEADPRKILISRGTLTPAEQTSITIGHNPGVTSFTVFWRDNSDVGDASKDDIALIAIVNRHKRKSIISFNEFTRFRTIGSGRFTIPKDWVGDQVYTYLGFVSADGKRVSNSVYVDLRTIPENPL